MNLYLAHNNHSMNLFSVHDDQPPGEPLPWRWGLVFMGIACGTMWIVIWGVGMW